jgi:NAD(P)-dependent dehydrogenase (short-subunit alcohol dehydrogenase family)
MSNSQRVAIITGASQGIGEGLVTAYRKLGYAVVANSRSIAQSDDPMVETVPGDIAQPGVGQRIVDAAMERFGRVDTVVNNAGIFIAKPFTDYTNEDYDAVTGVSLRGFFEVSRAAVAAMLSREGGGHIVNISTSLVDHANSQVPAALASLTKGGLDAVTKALAIEYAAQGIRSNAVALGVIQTPMQIRPPTSSWPSCTPSDAWARSTTWSSRWYISKPPRSSPVRSCTWTVVKVQGTNQISSDLRHPALPTGQDAACVATGSSRRSPLVLRLRRRCARCPRIRGASRRRLASRTRGPHRQAARRRRTSRRR